MKTSTIKQITRTFSIAVLTLIGFFTLQSFNSIQEMENQKSKKVKIVEIPFEGETINVSAERLWEIIGDDFASVGKWATSVDHSVGSGDAEFNGATCSDRSCDVNAKGFSAISEKLTQFDTSSKELTYIVEEGFPKFITLAQNHWQVVSIAPNKSKIKMVAHMEMKLFMGALVGGKLKKNLSTLLPIIANDLKVYAETGEVSASKKARMTKLSK